jgi:uncharacterized protein YbjT (DUF2867 family)
VTAGVPKIVFVSSMSAYFGTRQGYGLMKLAVERTALDTGCVVIRPGLVYGESPGGVAGTLQKISRLPIWPRFKSARLFVAHEDDIASATVGVLDAYNELAGEVLGFANPESLDLSSILTGLSATHKRRRSVPVPAWAAVVGLRVLETAGVPFPFRSAWATASRRTRRPVPESGRLVGDPHRCDDAPVIRTRNRHRVKRLRGSFESICGRLR